MKKVPKLIMSIIVALLLIGGLFAYINGGIRTSPKHTHPPCNQLPSVKEATIALNNHKTFSHEIEDLGNGITVEVGKPCSDDQDRGLILVKYDVKTDRKAINDLLTNSEGFGVPVYVVKR